MRAFGLLVLAVSLGALAACAPRMAPAPIVQTPRFPEYLPPDVPAELLGTRAAQHQDRAWRFLQTGDLRSAERETASALRASPDFAAAAITDGYVRLAQGRAEEALTRFDGVLAEGAGSAPAFVGRGHALEAMSREAEAVAAFEAALLVNPALPDVRRRVEIVRFRALERDLAAARQAVRDGRLEEAERAYRAALESSPESAFLYRELAGIERQRGNTDLAIEHFRRAVALDPYDTGSIAQLGTALEDIGDLRGALDVYEQALALESMPTIVARRDAARERLELAALPAEYRAIEGNAELTRGELAALIGVRLPLVLQAAPARGGIVMTDVRNEWSEDWIVAVAQAGVMTPYANHTFQPRAVVRRVDLAQAVAELLARIAGPAQVRAWQAAASGFTDMSSGHLAYPAVSTAVAAGVMAPAPDGGFAPSASVSGAEAIAAIDRLQSMAGSYASQGFGAR